MASRMKLTALRARDWTVLLIGWLPVAWVLLSELVAELSREQSGRLLGLLPEDSPAAAAYWAVLAALVTLSFAWAALQRSPDGGPFRVIRTGPAAYLGLLAAFALLAIYLPTWPGGYLHRTLRVGMALAVALALVWLFFRREDTPVEALVLTGVWAVLLGVARDTFPALPLEWAAVVGEASVTARATALAGQVIQIALLLMPLALAVPPVRRAGWRVVEWLVARPAWQPGSVIAAVALAQGAYSLSSTVRLLTPFAALRMAVMVGVAAGGVLALKAMRLGPPPPAADGLSAPGRWWYPAGLAVLVGIYTLLAIRLGFNYLDFINPDGLAYLKIARDYAAGKSVVRGYWAPLMSWLMAPLLRFGALPQAAHKVVAALGGLLWVLATVAFARRLKLSQAGRLALAVLMVTITAQLIYIPSTPDVLAAGVLALYFVLITNPGYLERPIRFGVAVGLLGTVAYLAKYYNLPFVLAHIVLTGGLLTLHGHPPGRVVKATGVSLLVLAVTAAPWVVALSLRYGEPTFSTSGPINHARHPPGRMVQPCWDNILCDQPPDVLFPWEDPVVEYYYNYDWRPFESWPYFDFQLMTINYQIGVWARKNLLAFGFFIPVTLAAVVLTALVAWTDLRRRFLFGWMALTIGLHLAGYLPLRAIELRYFLPEFTFLFASFYVFVEAVLRRLRPAAASLFLAVTLFLGPILGFTDFVNLTSLLTHPNDPCLRLDAPAFREHLVAPMAGENPQVNAIAYFTGVRTYGGLHDISHDPAASDASLREMGVATFVAPSEHELVRALIHEYGYEVVARLPLCGVEQTVLRVPLTDK